MQGGTLGAAQVTAQHSYASGERGFLIIWNSDCSLSAEQRLDLHFLTVLIACNGRCLWSQGSDQRPF